MLKFFKTKNLPASVVCACEYDDDLHVTKLAFIGTARDMTASEAVTPVNLSIIPDDEWIVVFMNGHVVDGLTSKEAAKSFVRQWYNRAMEAEEI